jgi:hypothetical protein
MATRIFVAIGRPFRAQILRLFHPGLTAWALHEPAFQASEQNLWVIGSVHRHVRGHEIEDKDDKNMDMMDNDKLFQKNLERWSKTCPKQAVMLPYVDRSHLVLCQTKRGEPNIKWVGAGKHYYYHSQEGAAAEAEEWFKALPLRKVPLVVVYGVGLGYYYDAAKAWLRKDRKRHLVFLENDLAVIYTLLQTERGGKMLRDNQVQILYFRDLKDEEIAFEQLYWNFALTRLAVSSLHSYGKYRGALFSELRHKIAYEAATKNALVDEYMRYGASFYANFYQNMLCLPGSYFGNRMFGKFPKIPAIICGAGPSLANNLHLLSTLPDKAVVFAGGSAMNVVNAAGFQPHFGAGIDPNPAQFDRLSTNQAWQVPFFYRNRVFHQAFKLFSGPRLYITGAGGYDTAEYFEKKLGIHYGEFIDEGHNVINFCVEIANFMGCDPIIFLGMDLAFTGMREYAPGVKDDVSVTQSAILDVEDEDEKALLRKDIFGKPTYTLWKWVAESDWIGTFAKEHPLLTMVNCTEGGLGFPGVPNMKLADAAKRYLVRDYELKDRIHGEIQNSALPQITYRKVSKAMKELAASLHLSVGHLKVLMEDAEVMSSKIKAGETDASQSGLAALAETELTEEPAFKHVIEVFNEVYSRILSHDVHEMNVRRYSAKQRLLKKLEIAAKKYGFLHDVARVNEELIAYAFKERKKEKIIRQPHSSSKDAGKYEFSEKRLIINDPECALSINEPFDPVLVPSEKKDGLELTRSHVLRVFYDVDLKIGECFAESQGKLDGQSLLFYPNGKIKEESYYKKGKLHGPASVWSESGQLLARSWFLNGLREGRSVWWYPTGAIYSLQRFKRGIWHGRQEFFYPDGTLKNEFSRP